MSSCAACLARGKRWTGDDPNCAFLDGREFSTDNWNCATVNQIRNLVPRFEEPPTRRANKPRWNEDQYWATIDLVNIDLPSGYAEALWIGWYKDRGRTEALWLLSSDINPRLPKEGDLVAILNAIKADQKK